MTESVTGNTPAAGGGRPGVGKIIWFFVRTGLAVGIITYLILRKPKDGTPSLWEQLGSLSVDWRYLTAAALCCAGAFAIGCLRWQSLLRVQGVRLGFKQTLSLFMQGVFFSLVIPGGALGGDVYKAGALAAKVPRGNRLEAVFTILVDRIIGMVALLALALAVSLLALTSLPGLNPAFHNGLILVCLVCAGGIAAVMAVFLHRWFEPVPLYRWGVGLGDRLTKGAVSRLTKALDIYHDCPGRLLAWVAATAIGIHLNFAVIVYLISRGIAGAAAAAPLKVALAAVFANTASVLPLFPGGFGAREWMLVTMLRDSGAMPEGPAQEVMLVYMFLILSSNLAGGLFFIFQPKHRPLTEIVAEEM